MASAAPRLRHSRLNAPVPANNSSTRAPCTRGPRLLKTACRTKSGVGRTAKPLGAFNRTPPALPPIMRIANWLEAFPAAVAGFQVVPEFDVLFVLFPAQKTLAALSQGVEIQRAAAEVFDLNLAPAEFLEDLLAAGQCFDQLIDRLAAHIVAILEQGGDTLLQGLEAILKSLQLRELLAHLGQEGARLVNGVMFGELHVPSKAPAGILLKFMFDLLVAVDGKGLLPSLDGFVDLVEGQTDFAQMIEDGGVRFRRILNRSEQLRQGLMRLLELVEHPPQTVQISAVSWFEVDRLFDQVAGAGQLFAAIGQHIAKIIEGFVKIRRQNDAFLQIVIRLGVVVVALARRAKLEIEALVQARRVCGQTDDFRLLEMADGLGKIGDMGVHDASIKFAGERLGKTAARLFQSVKSIAFLL